MDGFICMVIFLLDQSNNRKPFRHFIYSNSCVTITSFCSFENVRNSNAKNDCELFVVLNDLDVIVHGFIMFMYHVHAVDHCFSVCF